MPNDRNIADTLRGAYAAWNDSKGSSIDTWAAIIAPDINYQSIGEGLIGGDFAAARRSREDFLDQLRLLTRNWAMIHFTVRDILVDGNRAVVFCDMAWTNKATGKDIQSPHISYWHFENGKIVSYFEAYDTYRMVEAATL